MSKNLDAALALLDDETEAARHSLAGAVKASRRVMRTVKRRPRKSKSNLIQITLPPPPVEEEPIAGSG